MEFLQNEKSKLINGILVLAVLASVYFAVKVVAEVKGFRFIGGGATAASTVSFSGRGEVFAAPDIATINLTLREEGKTVAEAQEKVATKEKSVLDFLKSQEIAEKDIRTESYNSYPKYDYGVPCYGAYCPRRVPKIISYEVSEYISVKVRNLDKAGAVVQGLGDIGAAEMNGPNFSIDNEDALKEQARKMAIDEAKAKAKSLSRDLGVRLVRIVSFSEDGNYPAPMYKDMMALESAADSSVPTLPAGENKITSSVTITYEIR